MGRCFRAEAVILICLILYIPRQAFGATICDNKLYVPGPALPTFSKSFWTDLRINDRLSSSSAEILWFVDAEKKKASIELQSRSTHVKYIAIKSEDAFFSLKYDDNGQPSCKKSILSKTNREQVYKSDGAEPLDVLSVVMSKILPQSDNFVNTGATIVDGVVGQQWVFCDQVPDLNAEVKVSLFFAGNSWKPPYQGSKPTEFEISQIKIEGARKSSGQEPNLKYDLTGNFYYYRPFKPTMDIFQVGENVYCSNYPTSKNVPALPKYFSYHSEKIQYGSSSDVDPTISHRSVYYDSNEQLARLDYENPSSKDTTSSDEISIIYDFNLGVQYSPDPVTGACVTDIYNNTFDAISAVKTSTNSFPNPKQFFSLDGTSLSYNGKYEARGIECDVFSGIVTKNDEKRLYFWYFSTDRTKIIEGQEVEKNVLVKMVTRPVSANGKQDRIELNFYNFVQAEPSVTEFDISACFNNKQSKSFILTFPGNTNVFLKESRLFLEMAIHQKLAETAGVGRQRVTLHQLYFQSAYLFVQFTVLDRPSIPGQKAPSGDNDLTTAITQLRKSISDETFKVSFTTSSNLEIVLEPEPNGLKEFKREKMLEQQSTYKEGSVIGVAIGMTILGFLLGAVIVNLIMSRKYGVSLFQKGGFLGKGAKPFNNPLNESSI